MTAVYIAADTREAEVVERLLSGAGIEYDLTPEAVVQRESGGACMQGLLFSVNEDDSSRTRELLRGRPGLLA